VKSHKVKEFNKSDIMNQINTKLDSMRQTGNEKVSIVLKPESLGRVALEIMNSKDGIIAKMYTENPQVKELLDKNINSLKTTLAAQGVNVNNIKVECTAESSNNAMGFEREQFNHNASKDSQKQNNQAHENNESSINKSSSDADFEFVNNAEINNDEITIQHNGKVDYKV
jgi:flagellar hook-length control protein FliK